MRATHRVRAAAATGVVPLPALLLRPSFSSSSPPSALRPLGLATASPTSLRLVATTPLAPLHHPRSSFAMAAASSASSTSSVVGSPYVPAFDLKHPNSPGGARGSAPSTGLFSPIKLRGLTLKNRIAVSPMCMYSSVDGFLNDWHLRHLSTFAVGGAGLVVLEATAVNPAGRISPEDSGLWKDEQIAPLQRIVQILHAHSCAAGLQIGHAGRKASTASPFLPPDGAVGADRNGWLDDVVGPSPIAFASNYPQPKELTREGIKTIVAEFVATARRAERAGFDMIELHGAHGYLISTFLSPHSNKRTDEYGGSLENRMRFCLEVTKAVRAVWPQQKPLSVRISCTDWVEGGWTPEDSVVLARQLTALGVDLIDCSSGGVDARQAAALRTAIKPMYQVPFSEKIKTEVKNAKTIAVGMITTAKEADGIITSGKADLVMLARQLLRDPFFPLNAARELGVDVNWVPQYERAAVRAPRAKL